MSETKALLNRITTFREQLEQNSPLVLSRAEAPESVARQLAGAPDLLSRSLQSLTETPPAEGPAPVMLTARARQLLEQARNLVGLQREISEEPLVRGLSVEEPIIAYHRETVSLTDAALRMAMAFPASPEAQLKLCDGLEAMLRTVRERLAVLQGAVHLKTRDADRVDGLARRMMHMVAGRVIDLDWFGELAEQLLEEARQSAPLRFHQASPSDTRSFPGGEETTAPARFVAAHALNAAQVAARMAIQDFEWANHALTPVVAAMLMDLGLLKVPVETLMKTTALDAAERRAIEAHPEMSANIIRSLYPDSEMTTTAIAASHEKPDGTGYPKGSTDDSIPSLAKLLRVADVYAALNCDRPHRAAKDPRTALMDTLILAEQGQLDREFAEQLVTLGMYPTGTVVELADGRFAVVVANHPNRVNVRASARPVVAVLTNNLGQAYPRPEFLDLAATDRGSVVRVVPKAERAKAIGRHYPELV
jgi:HD-GYP domain-containing protein (c-di-GMP phosphodiesterase class II)